MSWRPNPLYQAIFDRSRGPVLRLLACGCIGSLEARRPLWQDVARNARAAAFEDPRFPRMVPGELEGVTIEPGPIQDPCPIWIASNPTGLTWKDGASAPSAAVEKGLRRVAKFADGWMTNKVTPEEFKSQWARILAMAKEEGRDPARIGRSPMRTKTGLVWLEGKMRSASQLESSGVSSNSTSTRRSGSRSRTLVMAGPRGSTSTRSRRRRKRVKRPEHRVYLHLCIHGDASVREISQKMGIERDVVHQLLQRLFVQEKILHSTEGARWTPTVPF